MPVGENLTGPRASFDVAEAATLLLDDRGIVRNWTKDAERVLGHQAADVLGTCVATLLAPDDAARMPDLAQRCRKDAGWAGVLKAVRCDGRKATLGVRVVPMPDSAGRPCWLVLAVDMTGSPGWAMGRSFPERMLAQSAIGMAVVDTDLRYVWSNAALERFGGGPRAARLGRRLGEIQPGLNAKVIEEQMRRVLDTGETVADYEHIGRPRSDPDRERAHSMSFTRLEDDAGNALGVFYTVVDITDRYRSRHRLALLDRASATIGRSLDVLQTAQDLADVAVPDLADCVAVDLLDTVFSGAEPCPLRLDATDTVVLRRAGQRSVREAAPEEVVEIGHPASYHRGSPPIRALESGTSWRVERLDPLAVEWATDIPRGRAALFRELGLHSAMVVPICARGATLGVTTFYRRESPAAFDEDDVRLAEEFVARAAVCIDNARRYTRERDAALALQRSLLPHGLPEQVAVEVASCYRPADELTGVGGDWFDVIPLSGARVALVVGDVIGHGIDAAATMGRLRTAVQTLADLDLRPDELLAHLDDLVGRSSREDDEDTAAADAHGVGASCLYVVYDPVTRQCSMASANHPAPAVVATDGTVDFPDLPRGPALGVGGLPFESVAFTLDEGSVLALYTDGLLAGDGPKSASSEGGRERLRRAMEAQGGSLEGLCNTVVGDLAPAHPCDDVALLLARTRSLGDDRVASWELTNDPAQVAGAREVTLRQLSAWGLDELAFTTELVVSELVTNAIRYASGPIRVRLIHENTLICEVADASSTSPHLRHPRTTDEGGRGLFLISQFTRRWGTRYTPEGKVIWAEQLLTPNGSEPLAAFGDLV
ncbi:SpoIIE family protein phosphatase [Streptomyces humicola]|uniref:SpoIIE family protein phosphatase n=1 Tax=Streptomyces humicola TaxID=2953240 RepID=UPI0035587B08